jgi:non-specific protein-tyrosine kinase
VILCHGWPESHFLASPDQGAERASIRVIAPDQRGYGAPIGPSSRRLHDPRICDLSAARRQVDKAVFVGHDWGGFIVWMMPLLHPDRVAGVIGVNTPHTNRAADPIELFRQRGSATHVYRSSSGPGAQADRIFGSRVEQTFDAFMRKPVPRSMRSRRSRWSAGVGASPRLNLAFPQMIAAYDARHDPRTPILSPEEEGFIDVHESGFTGGINWYRNMSRNWQRSASTIPSGAVADDHGRKRSRAAAVRGRRHGEVVRSGEISGPGQRPLDAAGKTGRGQRQADRMA